MNNTPINAEKFQKIIDELPADEREYLRECIESMIRCFMQDTDSLGVFVATTRTGYGAHVYAMNADSVEVKIMLESVLFNKFADEEAMKMPKEKLN
jgi:hypothetical protein